MLALSAILWTGAPVRADVKIYSAMAGGVKLRYSVPGGQVREAEVGPMQQTTLSCSEKQLELVVQDEKGADLGKTTLVNQRYFVLGPGKDGKAALTPAGESEAGRSLSKSVQIFNATGYAMSVKFYPIDDEESVAEATLPANQACAPCPLPDGTFKLYLKDEGGNPMGKAYSYVKPGHFYVIFRKRGTLYDLESLGSLSETGPR